MRKLEFPKDFLWGTATAAHQVEGNNIHSDWWVWEQSGGGAEPSGRASNQYELYKEDFQLAKSLNNNAHRLSLEWARLEPEKGKFSLKEVAHYRDVLKTLKDLGLVTFVTLHHFTNPQWFAKLGGFSRRKNLAHFENYVKFCAKNFGELADFWLIINEPNVYVALAYLRGLWPPQKKSLLLGSRVFLNLARAHRRAYKILHRELPTCQVSSAINLSAFQPKSKNILNSLFCKIIKFIGDDLFLFLTRKSYDFIGINYYFSKKVSLTISKLFPKPQEMEEILLDGRSDLGWGIYPRGIYEVIMDSARRLKKPIYITENGIADEADAKRGKFIVEHLKWVHKAIEDGADVRGYFYWSLIDNFEWAFGFKPRFGLFEVDYKTWERKPRKSASLYAEICKNNSLL